MSGQFVDIKGLTGSQACIKRTFDIIGAVIGIGLAGWIIALAWVAAGIDTRSSGLFVQKRVGKGGRIISVYKIRTMRSMDTVETTVTRCDDPRITQLGRILRRTKIDELPQLWNVLKGDMSFVGPRPDVPGFADKLMGVERAVLSVRPGITGPASIKYSDEEVLLSKVEDPEVYNREVIWPDKVRINLMYIKNWSLAGDLRYLLQTMFG
jgi:lipopolysaccharide/colanic/teichoic acid biosynthesis glycosyltransferase